MILFRNELFLLTWLSGPTDVVYDPTIISALVGVLRSFLSQTRPTGEQRTAYVASTMRNSQTIDMFVKELGMLLFFLTTVFTTNLCCNKIITLWWLSNHFLSVSVAEAL